MLLIMPSETPSPLELELRAEQTVNSLSRSWVIVFTPSLFMVRRWCRWNLFIWFGQSWRSHLHHVVSSATLIVELVTIIEQVIAASVLRCDEEALSALSFVWFGGEALALALVVFGGCGRVWDHDRLGKICAKQIAFFTPILSIISACCAWRCGLILPMTVDKVWMESGRRNGMLQPVCSEGSSSQ